MASSWRLSSGFTSPKKLADLSDEGRSGRSAVSYRQQTAEILQGGLTALGMIVDESGENEGSASCSSGMFVILHARRRVFADDAADEIQQIRSRRDISSSGSRIRTSSSAVRRKRL